MLYSNYKYLKINNLWADLMKILNKDFIKFQEESIKSIMVLLLRI